MSHLNLKTTVVFLIFCFNSVLSSMAYARDINIEQRNASEARSEYNAAQANYESLSKQITMLEQHIAEQQAKLNALKNQQSAAQSEIDRTKSNLDQKVEILERAWEERNR